MPTGTKLLVCGAVPIFASDIARDAQRATHNALGARASTTLVARVTRLQAATFKAHARTLGVAPGVLLRALAAKVEAADKSAIAEITAVLNLAPDADLDAVIAAITDLYGAEPDDSATSTPDAATAESADPQPVALARRLGDPRALSPAQQQQRLAGRAQLRSAPSAVLTSNKKAKS